MTTRESCGFCGRSSASMRAPTPTPVCRLRSRIWSDVSASTTTPRSRWRRFSTGSPSRSRTNNQGHLSESHQPDQWIELARQHAFLDAEEHIALGPVEARLAGVCLGALPLHRQRRPDAAYAIREAEATLFETQRALREAMSQIHLPAQSI